MREREREDFDIKMWSQSLANIHGKSQVKPGAVCQVIFFTRFSRLQRERLSSKGCVTVQQNLALITITIANSLLPFSNPLLAHTAKCSTHNACQITYLKLCIKTWSQKEIRSPPHEQYSIPSGVAGESCYNDEEKTREFRRTSWNSESSAVRRETLRVPPYVVKLWEFRRTSWNSE